MRRVATPLVLPKTIRVNPSKKYVTTLPPIRRSNYISMKLESRTDPLVVKIIPKWIERKNIRRYASSSTSPPMSYLPIPPVGGTSSKFIPKTLTEEQVAEIKQLISEELTIRDLMYMYTNEALQSGAIVLTGITVGAFLLIIVNEVRYRNTQKKLHDLLKDSNIVRIL